MKKTAHDSEQALVKDMQRQYSVEEMLDMTGFLHEPLPLAPFAGGDVEEQRKKAEPAEKELLLQEEDFYREAPLTLKEWAPWQQPDGDYCNFGQITYELNPEQKDWTGYTRIRFQAKAEGEGNRTPFVYVNLTNEGKIPMPDEFDRTGQHQISLTYGQWTDCTWEISELPRDCITKIQISLLINGSDNAVGETTALRVTGLKLEKAVPHVSSGWHQENTLSYSQSGYRKDGIKYAVTTEKTESFSLIAADGTERVFPAEEKEFLGEKYYVLDFSEVTEEGQYCLRAGSQCTPFFSIAEEVFDGAALKLCNFIFAERCGYPIPGKHLCCHSDVIVTHPDGRKMNYSGGWHDAGDMSQQTLQTGEIAQALYQAALKAEKEGKKKLADRLLEEARWGIAFILKTRFGDGFRATSAGLTRYTRGYTGDMDDVYARCHDHDFENFLLSMAEAKAAMAERDKDRSLSDQLMKAAKEDLQFGLNKLDRWQDDLPSFYEHSYSSSYSLHMAAAICAASANEEALDLIEKLMPELLACQYTGDDYGLSGFFCRDASLSEPVHFNHQSREYLFAQALTEGAQALRKAGTRKTMELAEKTEQAARSYAAYLKQLMAYASPYGMIPAGIQFLSETEDEESFTLLHLFADPKKQKASMEKQIRAGVTVGKDAYVRQFPVWFSFRGNNAVLLSQGMAARILGDALADPELTAIADRQLYFVCGLNPFAQSLIYGEGHAYAKQYAAQPGQIIGQIPVGMETYEDADEPFYPEANNATYKEIWTSPAARFLGCL